MIVQLPDEIDLIEQDLRVEKLCDYLRKISKATLEFKETLECRGPLILLKAAQKVLKRTFNLLGMKTYK